MTSIMFIYLKKLIVNHRTYLRGLTSKGNIACTKRFSEITSRAGSEIKISMVRLTNLNPKAGSEAPHPNKDVQGEEHYVVCSPFDRSKQPPGRTRENGEKPKGIIFCQKLSEFGISRSTKVWGRRRIHSTIIIGRKGSSKFTVDESELEGSNVENLFKRL